MKTGIKTDDKPTIKDIAMAYTRKTAKDLFFMYGLSFLTADSTNEAITIATRIIRIIL